MECVATVAELAAVVNRLSYSEEVSVPEQAYETFRTIVVTMTDKDEDARAELSHDLMASLANGGAESKRGTIPKYVNGLNELMALVPNRHTGRVMTLRASDEGYAAYWCLPTTDVPTAAVSLARLREIDKRMHDLGVDEIASKEAHATVMMSLAHLDASLHPHLEMPSFRAHAAAMRKMDDLPRTFVLLITADASGVLRNLRARGEQVKYAVDEALKSDALKEIRSGSSLDWTVHAYASLWRCALGGGHDLLKRVQESGNPLRPLDHAPRQRPAASAYAPIWIDGVFNSVCLAAYLRERSGEARKSCTIKRGIRNRLLSLIITMLHREAEDGIYYERLYFRLSHEQDAEFFRSFDPEGVQCEWLPRPSMREIPMCLRLRPWTLESLVFAGPDDAEHAKGSPKLSVRSEFRSLIELYKKAASGSLGVDTAPARTRADGDDR